MVGDRKLEDLPKLFVELYLADIIEEGLDGNENSDGTQAYGIRMCFEPDQALSHQTLQVLQAGNASFPFEFYSISFATFSGEPYNGYTKKLRL